LRLLKTQEHKDLTIALCQWLQRFTNQRSWSMHVYAANVHRHRLHSEACFVARYQKIANLNWTIRRIDFHLHAPGIRHQHATFTCLTERHSRLGRDNASHATVVRLARRDHLIGLVGSRMTTVGFPFDCDRTCASTLRRRECVDGIRVIKLSRR